MVTYCSGSSTGWVLIFWCRLSMRSSMKGHCRGHIWSDLTHRPFTSSHYFRCHCVSVSSDISLTTPKTKQYNVTPMAQTSRAWKQTRVNVHHRDPHHPWLWVLRSLKMHWLFRHWTYLDIQHCRVSDLAREVLAGLGECLWSEECRRSHRAGQQGVSSLKLVTDSKVGDFNVSVLTNQQVRWLNVSVNDLLIVYCREVERTSFLSTANLQTLRRMSRWFLNSQYSIPLSRSWK